MLKITIVSSCEDLEMFVSSIFSVDKISKILLNVIISFVDIPCFHSVTRFYIFQKKLFQKQQHLIAVDQEMVTINYQQIPFYIRFLD